MIRGISPPRWWSGVGTTCLIVSKKISVIAESFVMGITVVEP